MGKIKVTETNLTDVKIIEPAVFGDHRGFFTESFSVEDFKAAGIDFDFIQDNHSLSTQPGVLRGLHFQRKISPNEIDSRCDGSSSRCHRGYP